jgi:hypothetical protein
VWVTDDAHYEAANDLLVAFMSGSYARLYSGERWTCSRCGEKLEGQFTACWNCGAAKI